VSFTGRVSDLEAARILARAQALIVTATEEFGIAAVEAQAAGRPVIALHEGGLRETVIEGETGAFFDAPEPEALAEAVLAFDALAVDPAACVASARRFDTAHFRRGLRAVLDLALDGLGSRRGPRRRPPRAPRAAGRRRARRAGRLRAPRDRSGGGARRGARGAARRGGAGARRRPRRHRGDGRGRARARALRHRRRGRDGRSGAR